MPAALVKIDVAAADLGRSVRQIEQLVEGGSVAESGLLWVFNLANNPASRRRDLRFWRSELLARNDGKQAQHHKLEIAQVIAQILPARRERFQAGEVDQMFQIRPRTRIDLGTELNGYRASGRNVYPRAALETFLNRRWIGHCHWEGNAE